MVYVHMRFRSNCPDFNLRPFVRSGLFVCMNGNRVTVLGH